jgi:hypothetical protein
VSVSDRERRDGVTERFTQDAVALHAPATSPQSGVFASRAVTDRLPDLSGLVSDSVDAQVPSRTGDPELGTRSG